jgi:acetoin utilization deacetylase AcuC-like enzyme
VADTGLVLDERCLAHVNPPGGMPFGTFPDWATVGAFERPERLALLLQVLTGSGVLAQLTRVPAREATRDELLLAHTGAHVDLLEQLFAGEPQQVGHESWAGAASREPALLAVGGLLEAVDAVLSGRLDNAFVAARPPGHHAEPDKAMGFCLFNATAIAARWAQREHGVERVAILDWDVHHGNGTEAVFRDDPSVLTVSLHQAGLYPYDTGFDSWEGNLNVPLPPGTGDTAYLEAWDSIVAPAVRDFSPDLVLLGAGQDAAASDPLGRLSLTYGGFRALADRAMELSDGRAVGFLEGGYSLMHMPLCTLAVIEGLAGLQPSFDEDPIGCDVPG